jgi:hypothetical protein
MVTEQIHLPILGLPEWATWLHHVDLVYLEIELSVKHLVEAAQWRKLV